MPQRFGNDGNIHSRPFQHGCKRMTGYIGRQWHFQSYLLTQRLQLTIDFPQNLVCSVENLLCCLVFRAVENREDIIFLCVVGLAVFLDNLQGVRDELKGQLFLCLVAGVVNSAIHNIAVTQGSHICKIDACRVVGE